MKHVLAAGIVLLAASAAAVGQQAATGSGAILRTLDKVSGQTSDVELANGQARKIGRLTVRLSECRYPAGNRAGDAFAALDIREQDREEPTFRGWMIASAPALSAMDHPRYDVWVIRCTTS